MMSPATEALLLRVADGIGRSRLALNRALSESYGREFSVAWPRIVPRGDLMESTLPALLELDSGDTIEGGVFRSTVEWGVGFHNAMSDGPIDDLTFRDLIVTGATKWASRLYRGRARNAFRRVAFLDTYPEHDIYWNVAGGVPGDLSLGVFACFFENTASQALQLVQREVEQGIDLRADAIPGGPLVVAGSILRNVGSAVGDGNARTAYSLSFFASKNPVAIDTVLVDKSSQERSSGCLLIEARGYARVRRLAVLAGSMIQPVVKLSGVRRAVFEECFFKVAGGQAWIDLTGCGPVTFRGCRGNVNVHKERQDLGPVSLDRTVG